MARITWYGVGQWASRYKKRTFDPLPSKNVILDNLNMEIVSIFDKVFASFSHWTPPKLLVYFKERNSI